MADLEHERLANLCTTNSPLLENGPEILREMDYFFFFFITLGLELSDTKVYEP